MKKGLIALLSLALCLLGTVSFAEEVMEDCALTEWSAESGESEQLSAIAGLEISIEDIEECAGESDGGADEEIDEFAYEENEAVDAPSEETPDEPNGDDAEGLVDEASDDLETIVEVERSVSMAHSFGGDPDADGTTYWKVVFLNDDGEVIQIEYVADGGAACAPEDPAHSEADNTYIFIGWERSPNSDGSFNQFDDIHSDTKFVAQYEEAPTKLVEKASVAGLFEVLSYTGMYDGQSHTVEIIPGFDPVAYPGYTFKYQLQGGNILDDPPGMKDVCDHVPVTVYLYDGNTQLASATETVTIERLNAAIILNDKEKPYGESDPAIGYSILPIAPGERPLVTGTFRREAGDAVGVYKVFSNPDDPMTLRDNELFKTSNYNFQIISGSLTITAWVVYDDENQSLEVPRDDAVYYPGEAIEISFSPEPVKEGYVFLGWDEGANAKEPTYAKRGVAKAESPDHGLYLYPIFAPREDLSYTVEYYYESSLGENGAIFYQYDSENDDCVVASFGQVITNIDEKIRAREAEGFVFERAENLPLNISANELENVIRVYYMRADSYAYTIEYCYDIGGAEYELEATERVGHQLLNSVIEDVSARVNARLRDGYLLERIDNLPLTILEDPGMNVVRVYYVRRSDLSYTVEYYYDNVLSKSATEKYTSQAYLSRVNTYMDKPKTGCRFTRVKNFPLTIGLNNTKNVIRVYYQTYDAAIEIEDNLIPLGSADILPMIQGNSTVTSSEEEGIALDTTVVKSAYTEDDDTGNRTYAFTLNEGLAYSDGTPVRARDYVFSVLLQSDKVLAAFEMNTTAYQHLLGYEDYANGEAFTGVRLLGEYEFSLTIKAECLPYLDELNYVSVTPYPISVIAPGCEIVDEGGGSSIDGPFGEELLRQTLFGEE